GEIGIHLHEDTAALVSDNTVSAFGELGYYESWSSGTTLTGNTFDGNYEGAEIGDNSDGYASNDTISNNFFRNSYYEGIQDFRSDLNTYTGNVATNNGIECGTSPDTDCAGFYIDPADYGSVTMTNNYSRLNSYGYYTYEAYNSDSYASTPSLFSGNSATYNDYGFDDDYSVLATWSDNTAYGNNYDGFYFYEPNHETITGNLSTHNGSGVGDGFYFEDNYAPYNPLAVTNNTSTYNGDYGFYADYPLSASSGNVGNSTNGTDDCWYISGCS
ncbi:MAG TPA: right-handed parallel beta-helix repeat-containing protein, partial [Gaiellaceae bacterium]|nr:right-handed parallel beta-helix repeat-containing protein [Gaiellaceae bacterium]